jgi:hypothetical protein
MNTIIKRRSGAILLGVILLLVTVACLCGPLQQVQDVQGTVGAAQSTLGPVLTDIEQNGPTYEAAATEVMLTLTAIGAEGGLSELETAVGEQGGIVDGDGQWAVSATASSQYGDPSWSAAQATGEPNTGVCGDNTSAWASASGSGLDTLTLKYANAVVPTSIDIHHTYNPGSVVKVEVSGPVGGAVTVYEGQPGAIQECPYIQTITIALGSVTSPVDTVTITVDQSVIGSWDEIDAVRLNGVGQ